MKKYSLLLIISFTVCLLYIFRPAFQGLVPIPSDTIIGLYHPYRDLYAPEYPNGVPYKNFLITDPVRQTIPWKQFSLDQMMSGSLPTWNPYEMSGKPNLANVQSSPLYPLNIFLLVGSFQYAWSIFVIAQLVLLPIFMYFYLRNLALRKLASVFGALSCGLSGFVVAWFEWGTIVHTLLWLPLILLSIEKLVLSIKYKVLSKNSITWSTVYVFASVSSLLAGHLQTHFYIMVFSAVYALSRAVGNKRLKSFLPLYLILNTLYVILSVPQWLPALRFINLSARYVDQTPWTQEGWYVPWQHLAQLIAPDFFGNYSTQNYWGVWNYGEMVSYIGIIGLLFAWCALWVRRDKKTWFFAVTAGICLLFMTPNPVSSLPFQLNIPFISTAQPTRMLSIFCFSLSVLTALGVDWYLRNHGKKQKKNGVFMVSNGVLLTIMAALWTVVLLGGTFGISVEHVMVARKNLILPTGLLLIAVACINVGLFIKKKRYVLVLLMLLLGLQFFDLSRFFTKFESFSKVEYFYPTSKTLSFLKQQTGQFRVQSLDDRIMPPNFYTFYGIQSVEGYDPLYLMSYAEFMSALERNKPDINPPFGFNRMITPKNIDSALYDLLNVRYVLSFNEITKPGFKQVMQEGTTRVYENTHALPRAYFVTVVESVSTNQQVIAQLFTINHATHAIIEGREQMKTYTKGNVNITSYTPNSVVMQTQNSGEGFLVILDAYYPTWKATIDGVPTQLYKTDYTFRGVVVPSGSHKVVLSNSLF